MKCERCGRTIVVGVNRGWRLGWAWVICRDCDEIVMEGRLRWKLAATLAVVGLALAAALSALTGCVAPRPGYPPWQGPGPQPQPSWTNDASTGASPVDGGAGGA